jgi:nucleoside-diphosphate-sugar epimerase
MNFTNPHIILVTGASGFIGSALLPKLLSDKFEVRILGKCSASHYIRGIKQFDKGRLDSSTFLDEPLQGVRTVIHLAARVHVMNDSCCESLEAYKRDNLEITMNLARQAASAGVRRFIFMSTIKVNGEYTAEGTKFHADDNPNPQDPYSISKFQAEMALRVLSDDTGMELVIIRPPLVYGPRVKANFHNMMKLLYKVPILPFGAIRNSRSFVSLNNLVDLISICVTHPNAANQIFLVSDDYDVSTSDLFKLISNALGKKIRLISIPSFLIKAIFSLIGKKHFYFRLFESLQVDITKTTKLLGWYPPHSFNTEINLTVQEFTRNKL